MPDREKVIGSLEVRIISDTDAGFSTIEIPVNEAENILALLKEQETKPPIYVHQEYPVYCEPNGWDKKPCIIDFFKCPNCEEKISENTKFCSNCGQAVKWE